MSARLTVYALALLAVATGPSPALSSTTNGLALALAGTPDTILLQRVRAYMGREFKCPIRVTTTNAVSGRTAAGEFEAMKRSEDLALIVLVNIPSEKGGLGSAVLRSKGLAVLNVAALQPAAMAGASARELYCKRAEKESIRTTAQVLGLDRCPIIRCALYQAKDASELDAKSRSLCPPCRMKCWALLRKKGVPLSVDSPPGAVRSAETNSTTRAASPGKL